MILAYLSEIKYAFAVTNVPSFQAPSAIGVIVKLVLVLGIVIGISVFSIRFLARRTQVSSKGTIEIIAARQVAPNRSVQVIDVLGKRYLIGVGDQVSLLADLTDMLADSDKYSEPDSKFQSILANALNSVRTKYKTQETVGGHDDSEL